MSERTAEFAREWNGRVAFITGAVTGIGLGVAQAFADAGMRLALSYRNEDDRAATAAWFDSKGYDQPLYCKLDVTDRARFAEVAGEVVDHYGAVHVLVNNAGVSVFGPTDEATYDDYDWIMGVNFGGVVNGLVSFLPKIKASEGRRHVTNIASMAAFLPGPQAGIYTASKFAVRGLTELLRYNLAPHGIGCSLCCPALTRTNAWTSALKRPEAFKDSGFAEARKGELEQFGTAFEEGMDPYVVGTKILRGMTDQDGPDPDPPRARTGLRGNSRNAHGRAAGRGSARGPSADRGTAPQGHARCRSRAEDPARRPHLDSRPPCAIFTAKPAKETGDVRSGPAGSDGPGAARDQPAAICRDGSGRRGRGGLRADRRGQGAGRPGRSHGHL